MENRNQKFIVCTVTNDLSQDQRMIRICSALSAAGYTVELVGRKRKNSIPLQDRPFLQKRLNCWLESGKGFYLEYNIRLFFYLLFKRFDIVNVIDLDTMPADYTVSKLRRKPIVYDAHEYFTELEEVVSRPLVKKAWQWIERWSVPNIKLGYTVSDGYAQLFKEKYNVDYKVVRNVTLLKNLPQRTATDKYILYQGAVNHGRGLEQTIEAMQYIDDLQLIICGVGDVYEELQQLTKRLQVEDKVTFTGFLNPEELVKYTQNAYIGLTLFTNSGLSNQHSLANRFFDYFHNGVPQLTMNYPEYIKFNQQDKVSVLVDQVDAKEIAQKVNELKNNPELWQQLHNNCLKARLKHNFQKDTEVLLSVYNELNQEV